MICLKCLEPEDLRDPRRRLHQGLHIDCFCSWFGVAEPAYFTSLARRSSQSFDANLGPQQASFFHGTFKKYSAELEGQSYILKMREKDRGPELPETEYLCNQIGGFLGIPVAKFYLIDFEGDRVFVTKNFIQSKKSTNLQHIYHFIKNGEHSCRHLINVIREKTKRPYDVEVFIQTLLYDALIGNHDRHGRNLAFITTSEGDMLSPIYDNVSYLALESGEMLKADFDPKGKISTTENLNPSMKSYVSELKNLGYREQAYYFYQKLRLTELEMLVNKSFCSEWMKQALIKLIRKRYKEIEDELRD